MNEPPLSAQQQPALSPAPAYLPRLDAAPAPDLAIEGQVGGATWAVAARGDVAYVGVGPRIVAYDVRPTDRGDGPMELAKSAVLGRTVRDLLVDGDKLYAAIGGAGVALFDIADPAVIVPVSERDLGAEAGSLALDGGRLYVALGKGGVAVLDTSQAALPDLGRWQAPADGNAPARVFDIAPRGSVAYAAVDTHGLLVLDVGDPAHIGLVGEDAAHGEAHRVTLVAQTAWVAADNGEVHVYDLRDPLRPQKFAQPSERFAYGDESTSGFAVGKDRIAISGGPLEVWDVADPFKPRRLGAGPDEVHARHSDVGGDGAAFLGQRVVVGGGSSGGITIVDWSDPLAPHVTTAMQGLSNVGRTTLVGLPDGQSLFDYENRFDVERSSDPRIVGSSPLGTLVGNPWRCAQQSVVVDGPIAFRIGKDMEGQLISFDLTNPSAPRRIGALNDRAADEDWGSMVHRGWNASCVAKAGDRIVLSGNSFAVVDAADPAAMRLLAVRGVPLSDAIHAPSPAPAADYEAISLDDAGRIAVGVDAGHHSDMTILGWGGIQAIELSNPAQPHFGPHLQTQFEQNDVAIHGHHAFVAAGKGGLRVYDIADVDNVREVGVWDEGDEKAIAIAMAWPEVLIARSKRLELFDIRDPGRPTRIASVSVPGVVKALRLYRGRAWVLTEDAGLVGYTFR